VETKVEVGKLQSLIPTTFLEMTKDWSSSSWRNFPITQDVKYPDETHLNSVTSQLKSLPGLVTTTEIDRLRFQLKEVAEGKVSQVKAQNGIPAFNLVTVDRKLKAR